VKPDINISYNNEAAFLSTCYEGHLEVAQWLISVKPDINISAFNEVAFRGACENKQLEVAKWLLRVKPDINISVDNESAFSWACQEEHLELAKWLQSLKPYLYVIIYDDNGNYAGYKIRSKKQANWEKRKCALHLAHQENTNILYHLPIDIAKSVIQFV
jgi:ankyrin repeat protein